jgi:hypothetical protein
MPDLTQPQCGARRGGGEEICGRLKGESNHWWLFNFGEEGFRVVEFGHFVYNAQPYTPPGWEYACSEECVLREASRWMAGR